MREDDDRIQAVEEHHPHAGSGFQRRVQAGRGYEADAVVHLPDGRWGAIEVKLSNAWVDDGASNLRTLAERIDTDRMNGPSFLAVMVPC